MVKRAKSDVAGTSLMQLQYAPDSDGIGYVELLDDRLIADVMKLAGLCVVHACVTVNRRWHSIAQHLLELGCSPTVGIIKEIQIEESSQWPFELVKLVQVKRRSDAISLSLSTNPSAFLDAPNYWRFYLYRPHTFVQWSLAQNWDYDHLDPIPPNGIAPEQIAFPDSSWVRVTYVLFCSKSPEEDTKLNRLRKILNTHGLDAIKFPEHLRPRSFYIGKLDEVVAGSQQDSIMEWWKEAADEFFEPELPFCRLEISEPKTQEDRVQVSGDDGEVVEWCKPCMVRLLCLYHFEKRLPDYRDLMLRLMMYVDSFRGILFKPLKLW